MLTILWGFRGVLSFSECEAIRFTCLPRGSWIWLGKFCLKVNLISEFESTRHFKTKKHRSYCRGEVISLKRAMQILERKFLPQNFLLADSFKLYMMLDLRQRRKFCSVSVVQRLDKSQRASYKCIMLEDQC